MKANKKKPKKVYKRTEQYIDDIRVRLNRAKTQKRGLRLSAEEVAALWLWGALERM